MMIRDICENIEDPGAVLAGLTHRTEAPQG